jgi:hypothetical protein
MHGYGMAVVNDKDSVVLYGELIANFGAAYTATQESVKAQGTTIASMQGQMQATQQYCMALGQQPSTQHLHIAAATAWPLRCIILTFDRQQKKSSPGVIPTAWRISWWPMPIAATHPVQEV